jgi:pimeloyl-ACP methyl ester carboxylesterase
MLSVSQPLHGDRKTPLTNEDLHTFNYFNPDSARANFRQGALDIVYLSHVLSARSHTFGLEGVEHSTDPDRVLFMGHSQGGITGAIALPFIGDRIRGAVLSGAGGGLSLSMVYREQGGLDIEGLIRDVLGFASDEELDELHPVAGLVQALSEVTDSANYAPYWFDRRAWYTEAPVPVLMFEGMHDKHTPPITTEALAAAAGVPVVLPEASLSEANQVLKIGTVQAPVVDNVEARGDLPVTAGLAQYPDQDHFAIHHDRAAQRLYRDFLKSLAAGEPEIGAPY